MGSHELFRRRQVAICSMLIIGAPVLCVLAHVGLLRSDVDGAGGPLLSCQEHRGASVRTAAWLDLIGDEHRTCALLTRMSSRASTYRRASSNCGSLLVVISLLLPEAIPSGASFFSVYAKRDADK